MPAEVTEAPNLTDDADAGTLYRPFCPDCLWSGPAINDPEKAAAVAAAHNTALHPSCGGPTILMSRRDIEMIRVSHTRALRWHPPTEDRETMNIHPQVRIMLRAICNNELAGTGVGYSEFIAGAILAHQRGDWSLAPQGSAPIADALTDPQADA